MALNPNIGPERVQTFDQPIGVVQLPGAGTAVAGILISTTFAGAPTNSPTRVTNLAQFEDQFGDADDVNGDGYYAVQGFFDNAGTGSTAIIVDVGATPTAADWIGDAASGTGLRALDSQDDVTLVMVPGLALEEAYLVHPEVINYTETVRSEFGVALTTVFSLISMPGEINRAQTDTLLTVGDLVSVTGAGPYVLDVQLESVATAATGTVTVVDYTLLSGATLTVDGNVLTEGVDWTAATDNDTTAGSLASAIDALGTVDAAATLAVITVDASDAGDAGNSITLATSDAVNLTISGATLGGGADGNLDLSSITAGMIVKNTADDFTAVITAVDDVADTITIATDPATSFDADGKVNVYLPSAITYKEEVINNPSRFTAWYFNEVVVLDRASTAASGDLVQVDPVGHVAGVMARIDANIAIGGVSHAPAGIRFGGLSGVQALALSISEREDGGPLRLNFINRLTSFPGSGNIIFGGYTAESGSAPLYTADERLIQVMRSLQFIKSSLDAGLRPFLWENFSPATQADIASAIKSFLRNNSYLFPAGLPESEQFKVISIEPTQDELDQGLLRVRVQVRPNKAVRFIEIALEYPIPAA